MKIGFIGDYRYRPIWIKPYRSYTGFIFNFFFQFICFSPKLIINPLKNINRSSSIFFLDSTKFSLSLIHTFRDEKRLAWNNVDLKMGKIHYNLEGAKLKGISLPWWPWYSYFNCKNEVLFNFIVLNYIKVYLQTYARLLCHFIAL